MSSESRERKSESIMYLPGSSKQDIEARKKSRLFSFLYGPYKQHHHLVKCVNQIKKENGVSSEMRGHIFCLFPIHNGKIGSIIEQSIWLLNIILPVIFILVACLCETDTVICICSVALCVLIACHAVTVFLVLHNSKIARRQWFIKKVDLQNYFGRENFILDVTLDSIDTVQFLSASQKSDIIARLARNQGNKLTLIICTKSFWTSRVLDPLLCLMLLIILCLVALIVDVDMLRKHYFMT